MIVGQRERAGGAFTDPLTWLAIGLLVPNDHVLKRVAPSPFTGKLSDFAGLAFFPLLLEALCEGALVAFGRYRGPSMRRLGACIAITGVCFAWMKLTSFGASVYAFGLGLAQWPFRAAFTLCAGESVAHFRSASIVMDPSDLMALSALLLAYVIGRRRTARR